MLWVRVPPPEFGIKMSLENAYHKLQQDFSRVQSQLAAHDRALKKSQKNEKNLARDIKKLKQENDRLRKKLRTIAQATKL